MFRLARESRCIQHDLVARLGDLTAYYVCQQCGQVRLPKGGVLSLPKDEDCAHLVSKPTSVLAALRPGPKLAA